MITETERLRIKEVEIDDAGFIFELYNSPSWLKYIGDRNIYSEQQARTYIQESIIPSYQKLGYGFYKIELKQTGECIGTCGFFKRSFLDHPDIGYAMLPEHQSKGYMKEASEAVIKFGKEELGLDKILAITSEENEISQRVLRNLGMERSGVVRDETNENEYVVFSN